MIESWHAVLAVLAAFLWGWILGRFQKSKAVSRAYDNGWRQCHRFTEQISESKAELEFYRPSRN